MVGRHAMLLALLVFPDWNTKLWGFLRNQERTSTSQMDGYLSFTSRALTASAEGVLWHINDAPSLLSYGGITGGAWYGRYVPVQLGFTDPDTWMHGSLVGILEGADCWTERNDLHFTSLSYAGAYTSPVNRVDEDVQLCYQGIDELGAVSGLGLSPSFKLDTVEPISSTTLTRQTLPTEWKIGWTSFDYGSGVSQLEVYEKKPGKTWVRIHTATGSSALSGSVTAGFDAGDTTGKYCYATVATDRVQNREQGPAEEQCLQYPV